MPEDQTITMTTEQLKNVVAQAVKDTLTSLGVDTSEPFEMQKDFQHLREWRKSTDAMKRRGMLTIVGFVIAGTIAAVGMGIRAYLKL